jgi:hypothetical protein
MDALRQRGNFELNFLVTCTLVIITDKSHPYQQGGFAQSDIKNSSINLQVAPVLMLRTRHFPHSFAIFLFLAVHCLFGPLYTLLRMSHKPGAPLAFVLCWSWQPSAPNFSSLYAQKGNQDALVAALNERVQTLKLLTVLTHHGTHPIPFIPLPSTTGMCRMRLSAPTGRISTCCRSQSIQTQHSKHNPFTQHAC